MDKKEEYHGIYVTDSGMLQPQDTKQTDKSKKRKRGEQDVSCGQALGLPPKASRCQKNPRKRIKDLTHKMGGGCSFPTSKNVIQPVTTKENFDTPERGSDSRVKRASSPSPLAVMQLNINGRGSRKGSLYETRLSSEDPEVPLLLSYNSKEKVYSSNFDPTTNKDAVSRNSSIECGSSDGQVPDEKPTNTRTDVSSQKSGNEEDMEETGAFRGKKSSLHPPDPLFSRMRTSLSESDSVFVSQSFIGNAGTEMATHSYTSSDENVSHVRNHEYTLRHSVGSADLINNCCRTATSLKTHEQPRAASVSGVSSELHPTASPRYRRLPTVENSVCFQEDDQINYYQILDEIGRGSYGSVYKCFSFKDKKYYAMKLISKKRLIRKTGLIARHPKKGKTNPLDALHREIAILKKVDHPNVVRLVEVIDDPQIDNVYMVFEIMEKGPIIEIPTKEPLTEERTRSYFRDIILGIEYLHFSKIIHRDIKPSNLLLGDDGHVKIADFGVSDMFEDDDDMLNKFAGSPAFQSPESIAGTRDKFSGKAADVWALGVTLFSCIYGECPFFSNDIFKLYEMIKADDVIFPDEPIVDPQFQDLVSRMLAKDPKTRITIGEIKKHPWITHGGSEPLPATETHCVVIEVTEEEVKKSVKLISKLSSLVLVKSMMRRRRLSVAKPMPPKFRSHSSPEFVVENPQHNSVKTDTHAS